MALAGAVTMDQVEVGVEHNTATAILTLTGPSSVWYGVGWGAAAMKDLPYAIIVDGAGRVTERRLADHGPDTQLMTSLRVETNTVRDGRSTSPSPRCPGTSPSSPPWATPRSSPTTRPRPGRW